MTLFGFEGPAGIFREIRETREVTVKTVDEVDFKRVVKRNQRGLSEVQIGVWQETNGKKPIYNQGAGPCCIVYVRNKVSGRIISGHFSELLQEREERFVHKNETLSYDPETPTKKRNMSYENFLSMAGRIRSWVSEVTNNNVEVFLFGQNKPAFGQTPEEYAKTMISSAIEQNKVAVSFNQMGVPYANIHDHRIPGQDRTDNTLFSPRDQIIYHSTRDYRPAYTGWLNTQ